MIAFKKWIEDHTFTPTELDHYQNCRFWFYAHSYLGIKPPTEHEPELTPAEVGRILHKTLERFISKKIDPFKVLAEEIQLAQENRPGLVPALLQQQTERMQRTLKSFQEKEKRILEPIYFEWSFGRETPPLEIRGRDGKSIRISGRIDRIDVDSKKKQFLIIDYKTGSRKVTGNQIRRGESLQLPLYILAVKRILLPEYEPIGGLYYHLSDLSLDAGIVHKDRVPEALDIHARSSSLIAPKDWAPLFESIEERVRGIIDEIKKESFPSQEEPCEPWCAYKDICRIRYFNDSNNVRASST